MICIFKRPRITQLLCFAITSTFIVYYHLNRIKVYQKVTDDSGILFRSIHRPTGLTENAYDIIINPGEIVVTYMVCETGPYIIRDTLNSIKSIIIFTQTPINIIIIVAFVDHSLIFRLVLDRWQTATRHLFEYQIRKLIVIDNDDQLGDDLTKRCAAQKAFLPDLFPNIDAMIYLKNSDTIFLGPVQELWNYFNSFNQSQILGIAEEAKDLSTDNPKVDRQSGMYGLADSAMLMNLTRMRYFGFSNAMKRFAYKWKLFIRDKQEILNFMFRYHWRLVYTLSCRYNYNRAMCEYGDNCKDATSRGVFLIHGSWIDLNDKDQAAFVAIYRAIYEHKFKMRPMSLVSSMNGYLNGAVSTNCGKFKDHFLKVPHRTLTDMYYV